MKATEIGDLVSVLGSVVARQGGMTYGTPEEKLTETIVMASDEYIAGLIREGGTEALRASGFTAIADAIEA